MSVSHDRRKDLLVMPNQSLVNSLVRLAFSKTLHGYFEGTVDIVGTEGTEGIVCTEGAEGAEGVGMMVLLQYHFSEP